MVDDSPTARAHLRRALEADPTIQVIGEAATGATAIELARQLRPDLVTMDVYLRHENGIDVTTAIMTHAPVPILIVTSHEPGDPTLVYRALEAGAMDVFGKLPAVGTPIYEERRLRLARVCKVLAKVPVVRRRRLNRRGGQRAGAPGVYGPAVRPSVVVLGASTGGPSVLVEILKQIAAPAAVPIVVVQHMAAGFGGAFAQWLGEVTGHRVTIVGAPEAVAAGVVLLAPVDRDLVFVSRSLAAPSNTATEGYYVPSIDTSFRSAAEIFGNSAIGVILTGMGRDGAEGLLALKRAGAATVAQDPATCVVAGMPEAAIALGGVDEVLAPADIAKRLTAASA